MHATLLATPSVGWSVGPSVRQSLYARRTQVMAIGLVSHSVNGVLIFFQFSVDNLGVYLRCKKLCLLTGKKQE